MTKVKRQNYIIMTHQAEMPYIGGKYQHTLPYSNIHIPKFNDYLSECLTTLATSFDDERHFIFISLPFFEVFFYFSFKHLTLNILYEITSKSYTFSKGLLVAKIIFFE